MEEFKHHEIDHVMRSSYKSLTLDIESTLNRFIVFNDDDEIIEISDNKKEKKLFLDKLIHYFEEIEEFEKCQEILDLKKMINILN